MPKRTYSGSARGSFDANVVRASASRQRDREQRLADALPVVGGLDEQVAEVA